MIMVACNPVEADRLHVAMHMEEPHTVVNTRQQHEITQPRQHLKVLHRGHLLQHTHVMSARQRHRWLLHPRKNQKLCFPVNTDVQPCQYRYELVNIAVHGQAVTAMLDTTCILSREQMSTCSIKAKSTH